MDKTYGETQGEAPFDWGKRLRELSTGARAGEYELEELEMRAGAWVSCACGNQCAIIPRHTDDGAYWQEGQPKDPALRREGLQFLTDIEAQAWDSALETLNIIETRSAILIREELARLNAQPA